MARVLIVTLVYAPDRVSTADLMKGLATGLVALGHDVTVLTTSPHYQTPEEGTVEGAGRRGWRLWRTASEEGVKVVRISMPRKRRRVWSRVFDFFWFQLAVTVLGLWKARGCRVVLVTSPPFTFGLSGMLLAWVHGAAFIYDVRELIGDVLVQAGMLQSRWLIRVSYALEGFVYRHADAVTTIARAFADRLAARGLPPAKIHFTPNFADVNAIRPGNKQNPFSCRHGLTNSFVILYAGNIGLTQGIELLVDVARRLQDDPNTVVLIVGDGVARAPLAAAVGRSGLSNIRLLPFQPAETVQDLYATADVCVSPMRPRLSYSTVPSKIVTAMAAGRPVVVASEPDTEAARLVAEADAGICVKPESAEELAEALRRLRGDAGLRRRQGENSRAWIVNHCSQAEVVATYDELIRRLGRTPSKVERAVE